MRADALSGRTRDHFDWPLFIAAALLAVLGVINLYSATSVYTGALSELYISQIQWLAVGGILGGLVVAYAFLKSGRTHPMAELKYRYLKWKINRVRRRFDVYSGGRADDYDRRIH